MLSNRIARRRSSAALTVALVTSMLIAISPGAASAAVDAGRVRPEDDAVLEVERVDGLSPLADPIDFADAYDADPLGLVAFAPFHRLFTLGTESWEVYVCRNATKTSLGLTPASAAAALNGDTQDYFEEISEGRYRPTFVAKSFLDDPNCGIDVLHGTNKPRIYVNDYTVTVTNSSEVGVAGPGGFTWSETSLMYDGIDRRAEIDGATVVEVDSYEYSPAGSIAAHEIGHTINWTHSGAISPYDNELDVMSLGWGGTHAFNRYAAGWIDPDQVAVHAAGTGAYTVGTVGFAGIQMVVLPTGEQGRFYAMSVRGPNDPVLDANSPVAVDVLGVEVYLIDQRPGRCANWDSAAPCFGLLADITPVPLQAAPFGNFPQFHEAGTSFTVAGTSVSVGSNNANSVRVTVGGSPASGTFLDDDGSVFEADIEWIAAAGITKGCNPPINDKYCPDDPVTRGQMAAFLVRALGLAGNHPDTFDDDDGSVFENDINALAASGITTGCTPTSFCPDDNVTRGQMAAFLRRGYGMTATNFDYFTDDASSVFQNDINALAASGVTTGCTPTTFCPEDDVTRGQMAAFLRRADKL